MKEKQRQRFRDPQGTQIAFIKQYAATKIKEADAERMKCSMIPELMHLCRAISDRENDMSQSKIYAALVVSGINIRYHDMKADNQDVIYDIIDNVHLCISSYDRGLMEFTSHDDTLFDGATSKAVRFESAIAGRAKKSVKCGVRLADVNLYNALAGVERFNEENPDYLPDNGRWIIDDCLSVLARAKQKLVYKDMGLQGILDHKFKMGQ